MIDYISPVRHIEIRLKLYDSVYVPADDTFLLISALEKEPLRGKVLELGTGTGIIAIYCAKRGSKVIANDINPEAIELSGENARINGVDIKFILGDLFEIFEGLSGTDQQFDSIIFNPPYLPRSEFEEKDRLTLAWDGGKDGAELIFKFIEELPRFLTGRAYFILSSLNPIQEIEESASTSGLWMEQLSRKAFFFERIYAYRCSKTL